MLKMLNVTKRQRQVLDFVVTFQARNQITPSMREIAAGIECKSIGCVHRALHGLQRRGYVTLKRHTSRSIEVLTDDDLTQLTNDELGHKRQNITDEIDRREACATTERKTHV